jgi:hypothetical protein
MKKLLTFMIAFSFLIAGCDNDMESLELDNAMLKKAGTRFTVPNTFDGEGAYCVLADQTPDNVAGKQMQLWMGVGNAKAGTLVGYVKFESGKVIIDLTDSNQDGTPDMYPYVIKEIHIHFASTVKGIPQTKNGNPIPGKFEYNITPENYGTYIEIPVVFEEFGAIHLSVVKFGGIDGFAFYLPDDPVQVKFKYPGTNSYLEVAISGANAGALAGTYENWCVNTDYGLTPNETYDALLYSSYEPIPSGTVKKPENFDLINYLINNYKVGTVVELKNDDCTTYKNEQGNAVSEAITMQDIQTAIWYLIDGGDAYFHQLPLDWKQERVNAIVCEVQQNGEGFEPDCGEKIVFVVVPIDLKKLPVQLIVGQPTVSSVPVPCADEGGTAWGDGYWGATFGGAQWGTWFKYNAACVPE